MRYSITENPYVVGKFTTGDNCTITIYDLYNNKVIVNASSMTEIGTSGYFKYMFVKDVEFKQSIHKQINEEIIIEIKSIR